MIPIDPAAGERTRFGHALRPHWLLEPDLIFLNHGAFGASPIEVLAAQSEWRTRMERQPVRFMVDELSGALRSAAGELAQFLGTQGEQLAFVDNATTAVNAVLHSLRWQAGDEVVVCRHAYPAVKNAAAALAARYGVLVREALFPLPLAGPGQVVDAVAGVMNERTRLAIIDHVSSPLAAVLPVADIVALCHGRGVPVLVDGAHAPGMIALELDALGADWYAGNCHKWLYAPKGCAFLWSARERLPLTHPLVVSTQWGEGYAREFDWTGTRDPSAWLSVSAALTFFRRLGIDNARAYMRALAAQAARLLAERWRTPALVPEEMLAAMATVLLPHHGIATQAAADAIHARLLAHRIEVPVLCFDDRLWVRVSAQVYNAAGDFQQLADTVAAL